MTTFKGIDEQDYINIGDLNKIRIAKAIIADILPQNSEVIGRADHKHMLLILSYWEKDLTEKIIIK